MQVDAEKRRVVADGQPSSGADLEGMELDFGYYLTSCGLLDEKSIKVRRTGDPMCLLDVRCRVAAGVRLEDAAEELARLWMSGLRYDYFEAHELVVRDDAARLEFLTQMNPHGLYVTGTLAVEPQPA